MPGALVSRSIAVHCLPVALEGERSGGAAHIPQHHTKTERQHHPRCRLSQWNDSRNDAVLTCNLHHTRLYNRPGIVWPIVLRTDRVIYTLPALDF